VTNFGSFLNEFALNLLIALVVFAGMGLPIFAIFYNRFIDNRTDRNEHTSLYVAIGVLITLIVGGLFSWKAMILYLVLFGLSGLPMIVGEFQRTDRKHKERAARSVRRKRLPYAVNGRIEDAYDAMKEVQRLIGVAMKYNGKNVESAIPLAGATTEINLALSRLMEVKSIQLLEE